MINFLKQISEIFKHSAVYSKLNSCFWLKNVVQKNCSTFFRTIKLTFQALPKHLQDPVLAYFLCCWRFFEKKTGQKKAFLGFLNNFDQKHSAFSARAPPNPLLPSITIRIYSKVIKLTLSSEKSDSKGNWKIQMGID